MDKGSVKSLLSMILTVACLSAQDVKNAECDVACKREGHHTGVYIQKGDLCACIDYLSYTRITRKKPVRERLEGVPLSSDVPEAKILIPFKPSSSHFDWEE